jgi:membrane protein YdbS with pleckstrin-like domain
MQETNSLIIKPSSRALTVYYGLALSIITLSALAAIISLISRIQVFDMHIAVYILIMIGGMGILAIVVWIHLEMRAATYMVTENSAQSRYGLLIKRDDYIQLGSVRSIKVRQGPVQHAFNLGDIILYTTSHSPLVFWDIEQPEAKREEIWGLVTKASPRSRLRYASGR